MQNVGKHSGQSLPCVSRNFREPDETTLTRYTDD